MLITQAQLEQGLSIFVDRYAITGSLSNVEKGLFALSPIFLSTYITMELQKANTKEFMLASGIITKEDLFDTEKANQYAATFFGKAESIPIKKFIFGKEISLSFNKEDFDNLLEILKGV